MRYLLLMIAAGLLVPGIHAGDSKSAIEQVLITQQEAWNRHDLDAFMTGYWNSPDLTFFSGAKETRGWQSTLDRYRATYAGPGHEMGKLDFSDLQIETATAETQLLRRLFVENTPRSGGGQTNVLAPRSAIAVCRVGW